MSGAHVSQRIRIFLRRHILGAERNPYAKFRRNASNGYKEDAITGKIQDSRQWQYLPIFVNEPEPYSGVHN